MPWNAPNAANMCDPVSVSNALSGSACTTTMWGPTCTFLCREGYTPSTSTLTCNSPPTGFTPVPTCNGYLSCATQPHYHQWSELTHACRPDHVLPHHTVNQCSGVTIDYVLGSSPCTSSNWGPMCALECVTGYAPSDPTLTCDSPPTGFIPAATCNGYLSCAHCQCSE